MSLKTETLATNICNVSKQKGLHEIFFSMAEKIPEHIAVIWYENTRKEISYQDLADCVLKMAQMLKVNGIREQCWKLSVNLRSLNRFTCSLKIK